MARNVYRAHGRQPTSRETLAGWLDNREPFSNGNGTFHGRRATGNVLTGRMPGGPGSERVRWFCSDVDIDYVVFSYATPIAWHAVKHGWIVSEDKYSQTTTQHQTAIRVAVDFTRERLLAPAA